MSFLVEQELGLSATVFLTDKCNLQCSYCYEPNKEHKTVEWETIKKFIDLILNTPRYSEMPRITLDFIGGEPFTEPELIGRTIMYFASEIKRMNHPWFQGGRKTCTIFTTTNGTLFDDPEVQRLLKHTPIIVGLSLDGTKEAHDMNRKFADGTGSYDTIMKHFEWWKNRYRQGMCKGTFAHNTLPLLGESLCHQLDLGLTPWANPTFDEVWTKDDAEEYRKQLTKFIDYVVETVPHSLTMAMRTAMLDKLEKPREDLWCGTGRWMVTMGLDGKLYPCHRFSTNTYKYSIGDVDNGLDEKALDDLLENLNKCACPDCNQAGGCPSCYAAFYDINKGEFKPVTNTCEMTKVTWDMGKYFYEKEVQKSINLIKWNQGGNNNG